MDVRALRILSSLSSVRRADEAVHGSGMYGAVVGAGEQIVLVPSGEAVGEMEELPTGVDPAPNLFCGGLLTVGQLVVDAAAILS